MTHTITSSPVRDCGSLSAMSIISGTLNEISIWSRALSCVVDPFSVMGSAFLACRSHKIDRVGITGNGRANSFFVAHIESLEIYYTVVEISNSQKIPS